MQRITKPGSFFPRPIRTILLGLGVLCGVLAGLFWLLRVASPSARPAVAAVLFPMNNSIFTYSPGWQVSPQGADPREPTDPWRQPAGVVTFTVTGAAIDLLLAVGDYWGYLYITVDGQPANALPRLTGNDNSLGQPAGYKTFYAPELQNGSEPAETWVTVQRDLSPTLPHEVRVEVWRSWGQTSLRGVRVWAAPPVAWPHWPGVLLLVIGFWCLVGLVASFQAVPTAAKNTAVQDKTGQDRLSSWKDLQSVDHNRSFQDDKTGHQEGQKSVLGRKITLASLALPCTAVGMILVTLGVAGTQWWLVLPGLGLIGWAGLVRPACWGAALLCGLPFYFRFPLPVLPGRALGLIDIGVWGGLLILLARPLWAFWLAWVIKKQTRRGYAEAEFLAKTRLLPITVPGGRAGLLLLAALISWALVATFAATHFPVALREWRTVFLAAGLFALLLQQTGQYLPSSKDSRLDHWLLVTDPWLLLIGWLTGAVLVALVALWQFGAGQNLITAEGVWRVRAFYGSPNNLALYLERTLAVTLALLLFARTQRTRLLWGVLSLIQGAALVLTFSKGALLLGLPAILATLALGSRLILRQQRRSLALLWWILGAAVLTAMALLPFVGTERFQRLLDFQQGTGFVRLHLWRSAGQMALDHPWLGVGPDNFLYQYRSNYLLPAAWQEPNLNHPHNWLLDWWTRLGLPGLVLALLFFGNSANNLWQKIRSGYEPALALGLLAALVGALAHGLIDASYALPDLMVVWVLIAHFASRTVSTAPTN